MFIYDTVGRGLWNRDGEAEADGAWRGIESDIVNGLGAVLVKKEVGVLAR
jgi:hypothetical protein